MKYVFEMYSDKSGHGEVEVFDNKEKAIGYCVYYWEHLSYKEQKDNFINDPAGMFMVYSADFEGDYEDLEYPTTEYMKEVIVDMIEETIKKEAAEDEEEEE